MKTINWNDPTLRTDKLAKPIRVHQPNAYYLSPYYTAIPMDLVDWIRPMLRAKGLKLRTFYVGKRVNLNTYNRSMTTWRADARYAKILCKDPKTGKREYL